MENKKQNYTEVVIIGAGFSGIGMAIRLKQSGIDNFKIFEKTKGISGTWYDNSYPGAACDIPSHLYCYSFEPNPEWSHVYSRQPEIKSYVEKCVDKYDLKTNIQFATEVISAYFNEEKGLWDICLTNNEKVCARFLISAVGALNIINIPEIKGYDLFAGKKFHSAKWDHTCDLTNKKVAIIGSAASAVQIVPEIASKVKELYIFQRTPNYIIPRHDHPYSERTKKIFSKIPFVLRLLRWLMYFYRDLRFVAFLQKASLPRSFATKLAIKNMKQHIKDKDLQEKLIPSYPIGCKRILISDDYYPTLVRENVHLITEEIATITKNAIVTKSGTSHQVDVIVLATGFDPHAMLSTVDIKGIEAKELRDVWKNGPEAYRGITVPKFPNFFILLGPNTGLGHNSVIFMIETQVEYVLRCIQQLKNAKYMDIKESVMKKYNEDLQNNLQNTVWAGSCSSWYKMENGKIATLWPHSTTNYWCTTRKPNLKEFDIVK